MEALGSPMIAAAITPLFSTMSGFTPKKAGSQTQRSASLPTFLLRANEMDTRVDARRR